MKAIILAGGKGTRLAPYTTVFPKPLVPIGEMPILEVVIRQLKVFGFSEVVLAVGHLAELIEAFFGSGEKFGLNISYIREEKPLGTAGPLALVPGLRERFLVMNGDILTTLNFRYMIEAHCQETPTATIGIHRRQVPVDFGVLHLNSKNEVEEYDEKPLLDYQVSMGISVFEPSVLKYIKPGEYLDFPELIKVLLTKREKVKGFLFDGYWLDIGRPEDYIRAVDEFSQMRRNLHIHDMAYTFDRPEIIQGRRKRG